jgi:hypothetical protein
MKKFVIPLLTAGGLVAGLACAGAITVIEQFDYTSGNLSGQNGGTGWEAAWVPSSHDTTVSSGGSLSAPAGYEFTPTGNRIANLNESGYSRRLFSENNRVNFSSDTTFYASWLMRIGDTDDKNNLLFTDATGRRGISVGTFNTGSSPNLLQIFDMGGRVYTEGTQTIAAATDTLIVVKFQLSASGDDTISASAFASNGSVGAEPVTWDVEKNVNLSFLMYMVSFTAYNGTADAIQLDELRMGDTYAAVVPEQPCIAALALSLGVMVIFRFIRKKAKGVRN